MTVRAVSLLACLLIAPSAAAAADAPLAIRPDSPALKWGPCPPPFASGCEIGVLRGDPAKANSDILLRVPGGFRLPPHTHSSAERMMLAGGTLRVRYQGHPPRVLTPGTYAFGPAGMPHEGQCLGRQRCYLFIAFEGPVDAIPFRGRIR